MKRFNVIIEDNGKFKPYDIMPYLKRQFVDFVDKIRNQGYKDNDYYRIPQTYNEIKKWVERTLQYQYWSRCEYEIILEQWPNPRNTEGKKIDIFWQCQMNIDLITRMFIEDIYIPVKYNL